MLTFGRMKKSEFAIDVARQRGVNAGAAADQLDRAVNEILRALRNGQSTRLPGLGTLSPGKPWIFHPEPHER